MDIRLPDMDEINVMQEIRKIRKDIPIIAQTAYAMMDDKNRLLQSDFDDYLAKPVKPSVLYDMLMAYLQ